MGSYRSEIHKTIRLFCKTVQVLSVVLNKKKLNLPRISKLQPSGQKRSTKRNTTARDFFQQKLNILNS